MDEPSDFCISVEKTLKYLNKVDTNIILCALCMDNFKGEVRNNNTNVYYRYYNKRSKHLIDLYYLGYNLNVQDLDKNKNDETYFIQYKDEYDELFNDLTDLKYNYTILTINSQCSLTIQTQASKDKI